MFVFDGNYTWNTSLLSLQTGNVMVLKQFQLFYWIAFIIKPEVFPHCVPAILLFTRDTKFRTKLKFEIPDCCI